MAIRETLARLLGGQKASIIGLPASEQPDRPLERSFDDATLLSTYRDDAYPYIFANKIGEQASQAPLQLGRVGTDGSFDPVPATHPVQVLLDNPNPQTDGGEFVHLLVLYMELVGHEPIELVKTAGRKPAELWLHNPAPWRIVANDDGTIRGYIYLRDKGDVKWEADQMTYVRWPDPNNRWYGQGRLAAVRQEIMAEEYASIRDKKFEKQHGIPPGILSSKMPLSEPTAKELQKRWEQAVGGYTNAGRIAVLGSDTIYQSIAQTAKDAQSRETRLWRVEAMAAAFGIPIPLIRMEGSTFANAEQARAEFWEGTLQPRLNRIARMLTVRLLPLLGVSGLELRFDYSQIEALGENDLQAAQTAVQWANTGATIVDEVRARLSLPPHPDKRIGQRLLIPASIALQSVEQLEAPPAPAPEQVPAEMPAEEEMPRRRSLKAERPDRDVVLEPVRAQYRRDLGSFFAAQHGALIGALGKAAYHVVEGTKQDDPLDLIERLTQILGARRFRDRLRRISEGPISTSVTLGAADAAGQLGIATSFTIEASEAATQLVGGYLERLSTGIETTTITQVRTVLETGLREAWTNDQVRAGLSELFDGYQDWRLDRIARTETAAAYNTGAVGQYREAGVTLVRVVDGDGDAPCAAANGSLWTLEEAEGDPLAHPNCTRTWIPETSGLGRIGPKPTETKADRQHAELMGALVAVAARQPEPQAPPAVTVTIAEGAISVPVSVTSPDVHAPVTVNPGPVTVTMAQAPTRKTVKRDKAGKVIEIVESVDDR